VNPTSEQWNITEASTLLYYMDHICEPRADMSSLLKRRAQEQFLGGRDYQRQLEGKIITDDMKTHFQKRKLLRFLKKVRFEMIPVQFHVSYQKLPGFIKLSEIN
jgi:hypothetical protein